MSNFFTYASQRYLQVDCLNIVKIIATTDIDSVTQKLIHFTIFQILDDHKKMVEGQECFELGVVFYTQCNYNKSQYKREMEWWLVDTSDVIKGIEDPTPERLTDKRYMYTFNF